MTEFDRNPGIVPAEPPEAPPQPVKAGRLQHGIVSRLRNYFLTGLILVAPAYITIALTWWFINWVDDLVRPFIPIAYRPETYLPVTIPGTGLIIALVTLTLFGFLTANFIGRTLVRFGEAMLDRTPLVRGVYKGLKQVFETVFSQSGSQFRKVGLVQFPMKGSWSIVFMSSAPAEAILSALPGEKPMISVFLPCTPNPTTGFYFYVPAEDVIELPISPDEAAKLVMSAGLIQPEAHPALSAMAAAAKLGKPQAVGSTQ